MAEISNIVSINGGTRLLVGAATAADEVLKVLTDGLAPLENGVLSPGDWEKIQAIAKMKTAQNLDPQVKALADLAAKAAAGLVAGVDILQSIRDSGPWKKFPFRMSGVFGDTVTVSLTTPIGRIWGISQLVFNELISQVPGRYPILVNAIEVMGARYVLGARVNGAVQAGVGVPSYNFRSREQCCASEILYLMRRQILTAESSMTITGTFADPGQIGSVDVYGHVDVRTWEDCPPRGQMMGSMSELLDMYAMINKWTGGAS